jgi:hypothetical protein
MAVGDFGFAINVSVRVLALRILTIYCIYAEDGDLITNKPCPFIEPVFQFWSTSVFPSSTVASPASRKSPSHEGKTEKCRTTQMSVIATRGHYASCWLHCIAVVIYKAESCIVRFTLCLALSLLLRTWENRSIGVIRNVMPPWKKVLVTIGPKSEELARR